MFFLFFLSSMNTDRQEEINDMFLRLPMCNRKKLSPPPPPDEQPLPPRPSTPTIDLPPSPSAVGPSKPKRKKPRGSWGKKGGARYMTKLKETKNLYRNAHRPGNTDQAQEARRKLREIFKKENNKYKTAERKEKQRK